MIRCVMLPHIVVLSRTLMGCLTLKWSRYWALLLLVKGGSLWTLTQKTHFPKEFFLTKLGIYQQYSKTLILTKGKLKKTFIFMSRHFGETMTILILHFFRFGAINILTDDYFVLRINQIIYPKQKIGCFVHFSIFPAPFLQQFFPFTLYRVAYKWRMDRITYQQVND